MIEVAVEESRRGALSPVRRRGTTPVCKTRAGALKELSPIEFIALTDTSYE